MIAHTTTALAEVRSRSELLSLAQVARMTPAALRDHVTQLRQRVLGQRSSDVVALHPALREMCELLEQDVADQQRQELRESGAAHDTGMTQDNGEAGGTRAAWGSRHHAETSPAQEEHGSRQRETGKGQNRPVDHGASSHAEGPDDASTDVHADAAKHSGGDWYTLWGRKADPVHPVYAAVVVACASCAWLVPAYLHELVLGLEQQMVELDVHLNH